ncbi:hypothetical protein C3L33_14647, partial [Rhododendron williamsianum]
MIPVVKGFNQGQRKGIGWGCPGFEELRSVAEWDWERIDKPFVEAFSTTRTCRSSFIVLVWVVNETLESISMDLGFSGSTIAEGGAFVGSLFSGWIADGVGRRRAFQLCVLPMIIGASMSATANTIGFMLLGRFLVGTGMGLGPPVAALYVAEVSPAFVRGTYGSLIQIATCLGLMGALFIGIPAKDIVGWALVTCIHTSLDDGHRWRVCFWVSVIPAALLAVLMEFCAESPHWLFKRGRSTEAEIAFEKLLGGSHFKSAMAEFSKLDRGDEAEAVRFSELLYGRHFRGSVIAMILMDKLGRKILLFGSFLGMALSMGFQVTAASSIVSGSVAMYLSVGGILLFVFTFSLGAGPVPGLLLSEIFPGRIRAKAMAVCMAVHWQLGPQILYTAFATFCLMAVAFVRKNVLETKGKSLQEIELALLPAT